MRNNVLFSIIVPVYNVERYIHMCLESILNQTMKDYEVILVDDGSTDNSGVICDEYSEKHKNVYAIHQENGGLSAARNTGLKNADGEYVLFVDSDDYIEENALGKFYEVIQKEHPDVIAAYGYRFSESKGIQTGLQYRTGVDGCVTGKTFYKIALYQNKMSVGAPYYLTCLSLIKDNKLSFKEGLFHEDELWTPVLLLHAQKVIDLPFRFYYYRRDNTDSITRSTDKVRKRALSRLEISQILSEVFDKYDENDFDSFKDNIAAQYMYAVYDGKLYDDLDVVIDRKFPIKYAKTLKFKVKATLFMISPRMACNLRKFK